MGAAAFALLMVAFTMVLTAPAQIHPTDADRPARRHRASKPPPNAAENSQIEIALASAGDSSSQFHLEVSGLTADDLSGLVHSDPDRGQWSRLLAVRIAKGASERPAMSGNYRIANGRLLFVPRYPFEPGLTYRVTLNVGRLPSATDNDAQSISYEFALPAPPPTPPTFVEHVYPSASRLPENQLKFYLHFSAPMSRGAAYDHIHLLDSSGDAIDYPFLRLGEELWDPSGTRFTLFFDPGRIKRGLKPREDVGPVLEAGNSYTLVVDRNWPDASGRPLGDSYRKPFYAVRADNDPPEPQQWQMTVPAAGSTGPFELALGEPLDHAMLRRVLMVADSRGEAVAGRVETADQETRWRFQPQSPWAPGRYSLVDAAILEDLAGNSIGRPFEVDIVRPVERRPSAESVSLPFEIPPAEESEP